MPPSDAKPPAHTTRADSTRAVDEFMAKLEHPFKPEIEAMRKVILAAHACIAEGIKWNAPSFRTTEYFATTNLRAKAGIGVILHRGAKVREVPAGGVLIDDPARLLKWLGKDRAVIEFGTARELEERKSALQAVLRQWINHL